MTTHPSQPGEHTPSLYVSGTHVRVKDTNELFATADARGYDRTVERAALIVAAVNTFDQFITLARNVANEQNSPHREQAMEILSKIKNKGMH